MHNIINVWGYTEMVNNLCFVSAVFCLVKHAWAQPGLLLIFSTVILKGDEERERQMSKQNQKLKPNIVSLSFDIFNPDFSFIQFFVTQ